MNENSITVLIKKPLAIEGIEITGSVTFAKHDGWRISQARFVGADGLEVTAGTRSRALIILAHAVVEHGKENRAARIAAAA